jgi:hypothetical protein
MPDQVAAGANSASAALPAAQFSHLLALARQVAASGDLTLKGREDGFNRYTAYACFGQSPNAGKIVASPLDCVGLASGVDALDVLAEAADPKAGASGVRIASVRLYSGITAKGVVVMDHQAGLTISGDGAVSPADQKKLTSDEVKAQLAFWAGQESIALCTDACR